MTISRPQAVSGQEAEAGRKSKALSETRANETGVAFPDLKEFSGSIDESLSHVRLHQAASSFLASAQTGQERAEAFENAAAALIGLAPSDELEGMLATQMIATHNAAMTCLQRAETQAIAVREQNLRYAAKFMALYTRQVEALDRHRGKGQHELTVGNVTVNAGGQAIVWHVEGRAKGTAAAGAPSADPPRDPAPPAAGERVVKLITKPRAKATDAVG
jgi:hypothetical protein